MITSGIGVAKLQLRLLRHDHSNWLVFLTGPLTMIAFVAIFLSSNRAELVSFAVVGPTVMAIFQIGLFVASEVIAEDKATGALEAVVAAPTPLPLIVSVRVAVVTIISLLAIPESLLVAWLVFGVTVHIQDSLLLISTLLFTAFASVSTSLMMAALFVHVRSARVLQNSLSYPFFLLSGIVVPLSILPGWLSPFSYGIFLTWTGELLRESLFNLESDRTMLSFVLLGLIGTTTLMLSVLVLNAITRAIRKSGRLGFE